MATMRRVVAVVELPRGSFVKRSAGGAVDFVSPLPCPWNYGYLPGTESGDGDPLDAVILGPRLAAGTAVELAVVGEVDFVDEGRADPKLVLSSRPLGRLEQRGIEVFFRAYARAKRLLARSRGRSGEIAFRGLRVEP
jgi:inorganic pyrophosphatase